MAKNPYATPGTILEYYANVTRLPQGKNNGELKQYVEEVEVKPIENLKEECLQEIRKILDLRKLVRV
jgi:hypothetical protein